MASLANIKQDIKQFSSGGISKTELDRIAQQNRTSAASVVRQLDVVNRNVPELRVGLNSGAANMLINQLGRAPSFPTAPSPTAALGTGNIARALQSAIGTPGTPGYMRQGQMVGGSTGIPGTGLLIGGTQIRPGGRTAINPAAFAAPTTTPEPTPTPMPTSPETPMYIPPVIPEEEVKISLPGVSADLANWATGFKTKKSSRKGAGARAQGLASQRINPAGTFRGGM